MIRALCTAIFEVADLDAAKRFYTVLAGKPPYFDQPFYVGYDVGGYELGLQPSEPGDPLRPLAGKGAAYFGTHQLETAIAALVEAGAKPHQAPQDVGDGIRVAAVLDPFGNAVGLIENPHFFPHLVAVRPGELGARSIEKRAVVGLPRAEVWKLWTTKAGLQRWLVDEARVDLIPGGRFEVLFLDQPKDGQRGSEGCRVLSFLPERMLSFTWNAPPGHTRTRFQHTWVVVELADDAAGTAVTLTHLGWPEPSDAQWDETYTYFDRAWGQVMTELAASNPPGAT